MLPSLAQEFLSYRTNGAPQRVPHRIDEIQRVVNLNARVCAIRAVSTRGLNVVSCPILYLPERVE
jgi:hypothetical protein